MPIIKVLKNFLEKHGVSYRMVSHPNADGGPQSSQVVNILLQRLAKPLILKTNTGWVLVVIPASHRIDLAVLRLHLKSKLTTVSTEEYSHLCPGGNIELIPPFGDAIGIETIVIDPSLLEGQDVYLEGGSHEDLVQLKTDDFKRLNNQAQYYKFSRPIIDMSGRRYSKTDLNIYRLWRDAAVSEMDNKQTPLLEIQRQIEKLTDLPAMPDMGIKLMKLRSDPNSSINELAKVIEIDPSLTAQVLRLAQSAYYGFGGRINSVEQAILRVLGFDMVVHMCIGAAIGKSFRVPRDGELGLHTFWRTALYSALICHACARLLPVTSRPDLGLTYLSGLLHDFGFVLLGHLFRQEYYILSKVVAEHPQKPITEIEEHVLGIGHTHIGAWLMKAWDLPEEIVVSVKEHHNPAYHDNHAVFVQLIQLAENYIAEYGIGSSRPPALAKKEVLAKLGIPEDKADDVVANIVADGIEIDNMSRQLIA